MQQVARTKISTQYVQRIKPALRKLHEQIQCHNEKNQSTSVKKEKNHMQ